MPATAWLSHILQGLISSGVIPLGWFYLLKGHVGTEKDFSGHWVVGEQQNQGNVTKIGFLVTQTPRQLTYTVMYFKHEENRLCLNSLVLSEGRLPESPSWLWNVPRTSFVFVAKAAGCSCTGLPRG